MQLQKYKTDERTGISYTLHGDYYLPDLTLSEEETQPIGVWGQRHLKYIKESKRVYYTILLTGGELNSYLAEIDKQAEEMFSLLIKEVSEAEGVTEKLKEENQLLWVQRMNNICNRVTEIINNELIFSC